MEKGLGVSNGIGIGRVLQIIPQTYQIPEHTIYDFALEEQSFHRTIAAFVAAIEQKKALVSEQQQEVLDAHATLAEDPEIDTGVIETIRQGKNAALSIAEVFDSAAQLFLTFEDEMFRERAQDLLDIKDGLLRILLNVPVVDLTQLPENCILVAHDLTPSMTSGMQASKVAGLITSVGGPTSHTAILARALEIPAICGFANALNKLPNDCDVALDGKTGEVFISPTEQELTFLRERQTQQLERKQQLRKLVGQPTQTVDGEKIHLYANIGKPEDVVKVLENDAKGIGLFRTEFLYMESTAMPDEDTQFEAYKRVAVGMDGQAVIVRTLDVGGDKDIPYMNLQKEENPFLGFRALRYCLQDLALFETQLRAILRASAFGNLRIMFPMISSVEELRQAKELVSRAKVQLDDKGIAYNSAIEVGIMIETPAAVMIADLLANEADFFSIGTNDLTQYVMAVDRGNDKVAYLYSHHYPAVLRAIARVGQAGRDAGIMVGMCGEAAADDSLIPYWLAMGLRELSVSPTFVLPTREKIIACNLAESQAKLDALLSCSTLNDVKNFLDND